MKFVDFGFPEDKILGTFLTDCPGWKVKINENEESARFFSALRLAD